MSDVSYYIFISFMCLPILGITINFIRNKIRGQLQMNTTRIVGGVRLKKTSSGYLEDFWSEVYEKAYDSAVFWGIIKLPKEKKEYKLMYINTFER